MLRKEKVYLCDIMKQLLLILAGMLAVEGVWAQTFDEPEQLFEESGPMRLSDPEPALPVVRQTREEYVERYKHIAVAHRERYGIPASIIMAQGILESDSGNSDLSQMSNNHFGIKCKSNWTGRAVYYDDDAPAPEPNHVESSEHSRQ